ncbi:uncharacterized protein PG986_004297 [Apiospora aurea]|uniref:Zn(2)-C6 fungal-type domain-containing protein n=1 Tax=Apiospora aurea TaxID=335848 RepID=A0ABR1QM76_9PEZI
MFGALRYNSVTKDVEHVELERADGFEARGYSRTACNECRLRKLKCSGDRNGCKRCRAICITCAYQPNSDNKSTFRVPRPSPSADNVVMATRSTAASSASRPQSRQQRAGGQGQQHTNSGDKALDHTSSGSGPHPNNGPSAAPDTPMELLYPLSPPPSNLDWDFSSADFDHVTDLDGTSSTAGDAPGLSALVAAHEGLPQGMDCEAGGDDYDIPDASVDLAPTASQAASGSQYSMAITSKHHHHTASSPSFFALSSSSSKQGSKNQPWESFVEAAAPLLGPPPGGKRSWSISGPSNHHHHHEGSRVLHNAMTNPFDTLNMTASASSTARPSSPRDSGGARSGNRRMSHDTARSSCQCVGLMLTSLESMGVQEGSVGGDVRDLTATAGPAPASLDDILASLTRGMNVVEQVLRCSQCNAGTENRMLLATIAQQLGTTATTLTSTLSPPQERAYEGIDSIDWWRNRGVSTQGVGEPRLHQTRGLCIQTSICY